MIPPDPIMRHLLLVLACVVLQVLFSSTSQAVLLYPYKRIHNASHAITLPPEEWADEFECHMDKNSTGMPSECYREDNAWLIKYNEEMWFSYRFLVREQSVDERYANLVFGLNSRTGLHFHHYKVDTGNPWRDGLLIEKYLAGPRVNDTQCKRELRQMVGLLEDLETRTHLQRTNGFAQESDIRLEERHFRLGRVLDAYGRYESGHLDGRYHSFGRYHQCLKTPLLLEPNSKELVKMRYCWARMSLDQHLNPLLRDKSAVDYQMGDFKYHMGVCLPRSCHTKSFERDEENIRLLQRLVDDQYKRPRAMWMDQSLPVESVFCLVDPDSKWAQLSPGALLFIAFILVWFGMCVFATIWRASRRNTEGELLEAPVKRKRRRSFWAHLDLVDSWREFVGEHDINRDGAPVNLDTLSLVKALGGTGVIVVHSILMTIPLNSKGLEAHAMIENQRAEMLMVSGILMIDALFVLSGMLMTFIVLKRMAKVDPKKKCSILSVQFYLTWFFVSASRYLRLVPLYFLVFWFKKSVFNHMGSGPNWDYGLNRDTLTGACARETWLSPFTPLTAYTPGLYQCLPQSWSLSNDLVFAFTVPPFILAIRKYFKTTSVVIVLVMFGAIASGYLSYLAVAPEYRFMLEQLTTRGMIMIFRVASTVYTDPIYRVPAMVVGVFVGYALYRFERGHQIAQGLAEAEASTESSGGNEVVAVASKEAPLGWPFWFKGFATQQALIYVVLSFVLALFTKEFREYSSNETKRRAMQFFLTSAHFNWSLACGIIFLRMVTDWKNNALMKIFSGRLWRALAKLAFPMFLLHWDILYYDIMVTTQPTIVTKWQFGKNTCMTYLLAWPLSLVIHLILEHPLDKLTKTYLLGGV